MSITDTNALRQAGKLFKKATYGAKTPLKTYRANYDALFGTVFLPNNVDLKTIDLGLIPAELIVPELAIGKRTILYAHGGGFIAGSRAASRNLCASIAHESACRLLLPEYRLAPESQYPAAIEDLAAAYSWLLREGYSARDIVFAGDGAGANLVLALVHYLKAHQGQLPAGIVVLSPWADLACDSASCTARKSADPVHTRDMLVAEALQYTYQSNFSNPQVSPVLGDLSRFPPLYIQCGSEEILVDDATRLARKAENSGVNATLDVEEGMWHLFQAIDTLTPKARLAVQKIGAWVRNGLEKNDADARDGTEL
jgi:acetyl esterase/lipase